MDAAQNVVSETRTRQSSVYSDDSMDCDAEADPEELDDDESTIEVEESQASCEDIMDELAGLQEDQEVSIEDLLKMHNEMLAQCDTRSHSGTSSSEEEILANGDLTLDKKEICLGLVEGSCSETVVTESNSSSVSGNEYNSLKTLLGEGLEEAESVDDDYVPKTWNWKKEISIGPEHQAIIPELVTESCSGIGKSEQEEYSGVDILLWSPAGLDSQEVDTFLLNISKVQHSEGSQSVLRDDEKALELLFKCHLNYSQALKSYNDSKGIDVDDWPEEDCIAFEDGLQTHGKNFYLICKNYLPHKRVGDLVYYYYKWKKGSRHETFVERMRHLHSKEQDFIAYASSNGGEHFGLPMPFRNISLPPDLDDIMTGGGRNTSDLGAYHTTPVHNVVYSSVVGNPECLLLPTEGLGPGPSAPAPAPPPPLTIPPMSAGFSEESGGGGEIHEGASSSIGGILSPLICQHHHHIEHHPEYLGHGGKEKSSWQSTISSANNAAVEGGEGVCDNLSGGRTSDFSASVSYSPPIKRSKVEASGEEQKSSNLFHNL